jgi:hypothetical protein
MTKTNMGLWLLTCVLLILAWRVFTLGMADFYATSNPARALFWRANHPEALFRLAEQQANSGQCVLAKPNARRAFQSNPLDGRALRVLAQCTEQQDPVQARHLYQQAVIRAPRDMRSHAWLFNAALKNKQAAPAIAHLDALLRLHPELLTDIQSQVLTLAVNPAVQPAFIAVLAQNPAWRPAFLAQLAASAYASDLIAPVFNQLYKQLSASEYEPWLTRLIKEQHYLQAYVAWANGQPEDIRKHLTNVYNGDFELPLPGSSNGFDWNSWHVAGAQVDLSNTRGTQGDASYRVRFDGRRVPFAHLNQLLVLPPGAWQLQFRAKSQRLNTERGLVWRVSCDHDGRILAESEPMRGHFDWRVMRLNFTVPEDCPGQRVSLMIPARIPSEYQISGELWLDNVQVQLATNAP